MYPRTRTRPRCTNHNWQPLTRNHTCLACAQDHAAGEHQHNQHTHTCLHCKNHLQNRHENNPENDWAMAAAGKN